MRSLSRLEALTAEAHSLLAGKHWHLLSEEGRAMADDLLTVEEVGSLLEIDHETVRAWLRRGLPSTEGDDGEPRISRADLDAFLRREGQGVSRDAAREM